MNKRVLIIICYVLIFAAGTTMGLAVRAPQGQPPEKKHHFDLNEQLGLDAQQRERMHEIWSSELRQEMREIDEYRRSLYGSRRDAVREALPPEYQERYDAIHAEFDQKLKETDDLRRKAFDAANQKTRDMLTAEQQAKYDEIIAKRRSMYESRGSSKWGRGSGGPGGSDRDRGASRGPGDRERRHDDAQPAPGESVTPPPLSGS